MLSSSSKKGQSLEDDHESKGERKFPYLVCVAGRERETGDSLQSSSGPGQRHFFFSSSVSTLVNMSLPSNVLQLLPVGFDYTEAIDNSSVPGFDNQSVAVQCLPSCKCTAGSACQNRQKRVACPETCSIQCANSISKYRAVPASDQVASLELGEHGRRLIAKRPFAKGEIICEYVAKGLTGQEAQEKRKQDYASGRKTNYQVMVQRSDDLDPTFDPTEAGNLACFANTSHRPNAMFLVIAIDGVYRAFLEAMRTIDVGDELLAHYGDEYTNTGGFMEHCLCGEKNCSKLIGVPLEQVKKQWLKYWSIFPIPPYAVNEIEELKRRNLLLEKRVQEQQEEIDSLKMDAQQRDLNASTDLVSGADFSHHKRSRKFCSQAGAERCYHQGEQTFLIIRGAESSARRLEQKDVTIRGSRLFSSFSLLPILSFLSSCWY